jgi:hypothetical protein
VRSVTAIAMMHRDSFLSNRSGADKHLFELVIVGAA